MLIVKEVPLRTTVELRPEAAGDVSAALAEDTGREDRGLEGPKAAQIAPDRRPPTAPVARPPSREDTWDDPYARRVVAALDVLTAAQDQARSHQATSMRTQAELVGLVDALEQRIDEVVVEFRGQIDRSGRASPSPRCSPRSGSTARVAAACGRTSTACCSTASRPPTR